MLEREPACHDKPSKRNDARKQVVSVGSVLAVLATSTLIGVCGCSDKTPPNQCDGTIDVNRKGGHYCVLVGGEQRRVYVRGTDEYEVKLASLNLSPTKARQVLADHYRVMDHLSEEQLVYVGDHQIIVGDEYHFYSPRKLENRVPVGGTYVDGKTGMVATRTGAGLSILWKAEPAVSVLPTNEHDP